MSLQVEIIINKSIESTWNHYTQPDSIVKWNFPSDTWECPSAKVDFQVGGEFSYLMKAKDDSFQFDYSGIFDEINLYRTIRYHLNDDRKVIVEFEQITDNSIKVVEVFTPDNSLSHDIQIGVGQSVLNNFKKFVEST